MQPSQNAARPESASVCMVVQARVERTHADHSVDLGILPPPRCSGCEGVCLWGRSPVTSLRLRDAVCRHPGELVSVSLKSRQLLHGALLVHGLPWAGLLGGAAVGVVGLGGDPGALIGALAGLGAGLLAGWRLQCRCRVSPAVIDASE